MSSHADLGSPAILASIIYQTLKLDFMVEAISLIEWANTSVPRGSFPLDTN